MSRYDAILESIKKLGAAPENALECLDDDHALYVELLHDFLDDPDNEKLGAVIAAGDLGDIETVSHSLKGTAGNLGLTPLYEDAVFILTTVRQKSTEGILAKYEDYCRQLALFRDAAEE